MGQLRLLGGGDCEIELYLILSSIEFERECEFDRDEVKLFECDRCFLTTGMSSLIDDIPLGDLDVLAGVE